MNDSPLHLAKREVTLAFTNKTAWIGLLSAGVILGISGPFQTDQVMTLFPRLIYWVALCSLFYFIGSFVGTLKHAVLLRLGLPKTVSVVGAGIAVGVVIFTSLLLINIALFNLSADQIRGLLPLAINVIVISTVITVATVQIKQRVTKQNTQAAPELAPQPAPILRRLPLEKRGALVAMSVDDHYVHVTTDKGQEMLLMRLSDAMDEVGETKGLQVHRSHWVAVDQVVSAKRDGAKALLTMTNGQDIPASRTYIGALKEAGILPG